MSLATKKDFEVRYGEADERVQGWLDDASALIISELAGAEAAWLSEESATVPKVVIGICLSIAYRGWSNPDALSSEALGAHTQAWADRSGDALRISPGEMRVLEREAGISSLQSVTLESPYAGPPLESDLIE
jgi:hypothetical protein